jgi:ABC-type branched-subunit amino acid transport system ATPase component
MTPVLRATGLVRRYGRLSVVDGVDLELAAGERRALIGPNGAGKSTVLGLLAGTVRPSSGRIRFGARDITRAGAQRRARFGIGRTFQTPAVFATLTVHENLRLAARTGAGLAHLDTFGLGPVSGRAAGALPHGRRRLLEIAMALAGEPRVLLLDEPAAGLTDGETGTLLDSLRHLPEPVAVLLVEHNQEFVRAFADTVTVLHQGRVLARGTPAEIAVDPAVLEVYLGGVPPVAGEVA